MKAAAVIITAAAALALAFGAWGRLTLAGRRQFDEMAGILPLFSYYAGFALAAAAAVLWILLIRRKRRQAGP
jgi:hypothetical protein